MDKPKVLLIDPDDSRRQSFADHIKRWGYDCLQASKGEEGIELIQTQYPDLVISNALLPDCTSLSLLQQIRGVNHFEKIPFFILDEAYSKEARIVFMSNGADNVLSATIDPVDLAMEIQNALKMLRYRREILRLTERLENDKRVLRRYFSDDIVDKILNEEILPEVGGALMNASIMFVDIRDSTKIAETIGPKSYSSYMSEILTRIMDVVFEYQGSVNEILGDGVLAAFGCPTPTDDHASKAMRAAKAIGECIHDLNEEGMAKAVGQPLRMGIGIATGQIFAGNIGSENYMKYAIVGPAVNLASRLQDLTKMYGMSILIDQVTFEAGDKTLRTDALGKQSVSGFRRMIEVHAIV